MDINYYTTYDLVIPYKKLLFYPVVVKDYMMFSFCSKCLTVDKNVIDTSFISMTDLEYLYYGTLKDTENTPYLMWFDRLLGLSLRDDKSFDDIGESIKRYNVDDNGKPFFIINGERYNSRDYKEIRLILSEQNLIELPDRTISKEVRDSLEEAREYKNRVQGSEPCSFEDYMISLSIATGWTLDYIYSMSARKFIKSVKRADNLIHYKIYLAASMSGMVEFKDKSFIKHWLTNLETKDSFSDVSIGLEETKDKISLESAKK